MKKLIVIFGAATAAFLAYKILGERIGNGLRGGGNEFLRSRGGGGAGNGFADKEGVGTRGGFREEGGGSHVGNVAPDGGISSGG